MAKAPLKRRRKHKIPDIADKLRLLYGQLQADRSMGVSARKKGRKILNTGSSKNRSAYVGVTKNGSHWQALINIGKSKKYIGSFVTEKEAALAYDFYSIGVHGLGAKPNFTHAGVNILQMIDSFFTYEKEFIPALFTTLL